MLSRLHFGSVLLCFVAVSLASAIIALAWRITRERKKRRTSWKKGRFSKDVFSSSIIHLSGLATIQANENEVVVLCVVRDGEFYLRSFLEHYLNMGVKQIVFLDNGSTDRTLEILKKHRNVSVFQTLLEFKNYELIAKTTTDWTLWKKGTGYYSWMWMSFSNFRDTLIVPSTLWFPTYNAMVTPL